MGSNHLVPADSAPVRMCKQCMLTLFMNLHRLWGMCACIRHCVTRRYPANSDPLRPGVTCPASGPLPFSPLWEGAAVGVYSVTAQLMDPSAAGGPTGGFANYVSCESTKPPQCFCTSPVDRLVA
jgi:hypothetical protein